MMGDGDYWMYTLLGIPLPDRVKKATTGYLKGKQPREPHQEAPMTHHPVFHEDDYLTAAERLTADAMMEHDLNPFTLGVMFVGADGEAAYITEHVADVLSVIEPLHALTSAHGPTVKISENEDGSASITVTAVITLTR